MRWTVETLTFLVGGEKVCTFARHRIIFEKQPGCYCCFAPLHEKYSTHDTMLSALFSSQNISVIQHAHFHNIWRRCNARSTSSSRLEYGIILNPLAVTELPVLPAAFDKRGHFELCRQNLLFSFHLLADCAMRWVGERASERASDYAEVGERARAKAERKRKSTDTVNVRGGRTGDRWMDT